MRGIFLFHGPGPATHSCVDVYVEYRTSYNPSFTYYHIYLDTKLDQKIEDPPLKSNSCPMMANKHRRRPPPLLHAIVAVAVAVSVAVAAKVASVAGRELESSLWWCGATYDDALTSCLRSCPLGYGCAEGTHCFWVGTTACAEGDDAAAAVPDSSPTTYIPATTTATASSAADATHSPAHETSTSSPPVSSPISESSSSSSPSTSSLGGKTGAAAVEETFLAMKTAIDERIFLYETPLMEWVPSSVYRFDGFFSGMQIMHSEGVAGNALYMGGECDRCHAYGLVNVAAFLAQAMKETIRYVS
jgi:hypothetical protein